jgi:tetratricopeptide (TPR) repeat protein
MDEATDVGRTALDLVRHQGMIDEILEILCEDIESGSTDPFTYCEVGALRAEQGNLADAIDTFCRAIELDPEHGLAQYFLGNALLQQGRLDEAAQAYRNAIKIDAKYAHAHRNLGITLLAQGNLRAARDALQKSMDVLGGGDSRDWFVVAMLEWKLGNEKEARRWYDRAVRRMDENDPENGELVEARAEAEKTLGLKQHGIAPAN